ncbi:MAG: hypothetical protein ACTSU5_17595 [Promethearchaeota archaeon]
MADFIRRAVDYLEGKGVPEHFLSYVSTILARFLRYIPHPPAPESCAVAALYIATRHPISFPNNSTREHYAKKFEVKSSSVEWSLARIIETLGFITVRDDRHYPYFVDPEGLAFSIINSLAKTKALESLTSELTGTPADIEGIVDSVLTNALDQMNVIPREFRGDLQRVVEELVSKTRRDYEALVGVARQVFI